MCIEVAADDGTRILLDLGMPLYDENGVDYPIDTPSRPTAELIAEGIVPGVPGLLAGDTSCSPIAAIVLTHAHADHYGLMHHADPSIPVYASAGTIALLRVGEVFGRGTALPADLRELPTNEPLHIGGLAVTALPVDHAAPDSRALLVEADGSRLVYSGDLRAHGRTGYRFDTMCNDERLTGADVLLLEGTTLGGSASGHGLSTESDVEVELAALCRAKRDALVTVFASGQNLDRLVSCYRAAKSSGRQLVVSAYQAYVLRELAPLSASIPQFDWDLVRVKFLTYHYRALEAAGRVDLIREMGRHKVTTEQMAADPGDFLWCTTSNKPTTLVMGLVGLRNIIPVWSMWSGYWTREGCLAREWCVRTGTEVRFIHSGGHAWPEDLERLAAAIAPKVLRWVHTMSADVQSSQYVREEVD